MPPIPQFWNSADSAQISSGTPISAPVTAGNVIGPTTYHLWNEKGGSTATMLHNARLVATVYDGTNRVSDGFAVLDEAWCQVRLTGLANPGNAAMEVQTTGFIPIGRLTLKDIPVNCARYMDVQFVVPGGANNAGYTFFLELRYDESSVILSPLTSLLSGNGIIPDHFDKSNRRLVSGHGVTANGTAAVVIADGGYVYDGSRYHAPQNSVTLNQTSGSGALAAGQSYLAVLSRKVAIAAATVTKGNAATTPVAPVIPAGEILIQTVTVTYQAGGTSVITSGNLSGTGVVFGEFYVTAAATGLTLTIGAGTAISTLDTSPFQSGPSSVVVPGNASFWLWLNGDGTFTSTATSASPATGSSRIAYGSASGGNIATLYGAPPGSSAIGPGNTQIGTAVADWPMQLKFRGDLAAATSLDWGVLPFDATLDTFMVDLGELGGGSDSVNFDIRYAPSGIAISAGTTIFTSHASWDARPGVSALDPNPLGTWPLRRNGHEVVTFAAGTRFTFDVFLITGAGTVAIDCIVTLNFRRTQP